MNKRNYNSNSFGVVVALLALVLSILVSFAAGVQLTSSNGRDHPLTKSELDRRGLDEIQSFDKKFRKEMEDDLKNGLSPEDREIARRGLMSTFLSSYIFSMIILTLFFISTKRFTSFRSFTVASALGLVVFLIASI